MFPFTTDSPPVIYSSRLMWVSLLGNRSSLTIIYLQKQNQFWYWLFQDSIVNIWSGSNSYFHILNVSINIRICLDYLSHWPMISMSPVWKFLLFVDHFCDCCKVTRNSFCHRFQNSSEICWTLQRLALPNSPGGGITILLFIVNKFDGLIGFRLFPSLSSSTVSGLEFITASTPTIKVERASSLRLLPYVFSREDKMFLAERICHSHTPPMWLAVGVFLIQTNQSVSLSCRK